MNIKYYQKTLSDYKPSEEFWELIKEFPPYGLKTILDEMANHDVQNDGELAFIICRILQGTYPNQPLEKFQKSIFLIGNYFQIVHWAFPDTYSDGETLFDRVYNTWEKIKLPSGVNPFEKAVEMAKAVSPEKYKFPYATKLNLLYWTIYHLNELMNSKQFSLPQTLLANLLEVKQSRMSDMIKRLVSEGVITCVKRYEPNEGKANEYIWGQID